MSMICHETGIDVEEKYHVLSAIVRDPTTGKIAYSNLNVSLGSDVFSKVSERVVARPTDLQENRGYAIQSVTGQLGGFFRTVQLTLPRTAHEDFRYLSADTAREELPRSYATLNTIDDWIEKVGDEWQQVEWPNRISK